MTDSELCSELISYPEKRACSKGVCKVTSFFVRQDETSIYERTEAICDCNTDESWQGIGDFTPLTSLHCDISSYAMQGLWYLCLYLQAFVFFYSMYFLWRKFHQPPPSSSSPNRGMESGNASRRGNIGASRATAANGDDPLLSSTTNASKKQSTRNQVTLSILKSDSLSSAGENNVTTERVNDGTNITRTNSNFAVFTTTPAGSLGTNVVINHLRAIEHKYQRPEYTRLWDRTFFCSVAMMSSAIGIVLAGFKIENPRFRGVGRDLMTTLLFCTSMMMFWWGFCAHFHNRIFIAHAHARKARSQNEFHAITRGKCLITLLYPCLAIVSSFVSYLPVLLTLDAVSATRSARNLTDVINIVLIILVLTFELIVFMAFFGQALAISPLRPPKAAAAPARGGGILRSLSRSRIPSTAVNATPPMFHRQGSTDQSRHIEEVALDSPNLHHKSLQQQSNKGEHRSPVRASQRNNPVNYTREIESTLSQMSPTPSQATTWTISFVSPQTLENARFALTSLLFGLPLLGLVVWPFMARRFSYVLPILICGQCLFWILIVRESTFDPRRRDPFNLRGFFRKSSSNDKESDTSDERNKVKSPSTNDKSIFEDKFVKGNRTGTALSTYVRTTDMMQEPLPEPAIFDLEESDPPGTPPPIPGMYQSAPTSTPLDSPQPPPRN